MSVGGGDFAVQGRIEIGLVTRARYRRPVVAGHHGGKREGGGIAAQGRRRLRRGRRSRAARSGRTHRRDHDAIARARARSRSMRPATSPSRLGRRNRLRLCRQGCAGVRRYRRHLRSGSPNRPRSPPQPNSARSLPASGSARAPRPTSRKSILGASADLASFYNVAGGPNRCCRTSARRSSARPNRCASTASCSARRRSRQELAAQGQDKLTGEQLEAAKVSARYAIIMRTWARRRAISPHGRRARESDADRPRRIHQRRR